MDRAWCNKEWHQNFLMSQWNNCIMSLRSKSYLTVYLWIPSARCLDKELPHAYCLVPPWRFWESSGLGMESQDKPLQQSMEVFRGLTVSWNKLCFGNIFERKKRCQARLKEVKKWLKWQRPSYLEHLETNLIVELNSLLDLEEVFWKQKAKCQWICGGEHNTQFFHTTVVIWRKRKFVE